MSFEVYKMPQGKIMIAFSDKNLSVGILEVNGGKELPKHNRPVRESLFQIKGISLMKLFNEAGGIEEVILKEGDSLEIEPNRYHIHANNADEESITFWKASGDIIKIIEDIKKNCEVLKK